MNNSILRNCAVVLGACLWLFAMVAEARPPWSRAGTAGLERILAQTRGQMSDAERERLRRDLAAPQRERGRSGAAPGDARRMTPQQREGLRRDMRDANRQLDRQRRGERGGNGGRNGNGNGSRERR